MKRNLAVFIIITIGVAGILLYFKLDTSSSTIGGEAKDFAVEDTASITKIVITDKAKNKVELSRESASNWSVNNAYPVRTDAINILLKTIHDIEFLMPIPNSQVEGILKQLATQNQKVEIYSGDEVIKSYYVGGTTQDQLGTYMLLTDPISGENADKPTIIHIPGFNGYVSSRYFISQKDWRSTLIYQEDPRSIEEISLIYPRDSSESFKFKIKDNMPTLLDINDQPLTISDSLEVMVFLNSFRKLAYESIIQDMDKAKRDSITSSKPHCILSVTSKNGNTKTMKMFLKKSPPDQLDTYGRPSEFDLERAYALINNDKELALIQYFVFDKVLAIKSDFSAGPSS